MSPFLKKYVKYPLETIVVGFIYLSSKTLGYRHGSDFIANFFKFFGNALKPRKRIVIANLKTVFPNIEEQEIKRITSDMWDNWGRTTSDYCNLDYIYNHLDEYVTIKNKDMITPNAIYVSAHYGNFEIAVLCLANLGIKVSQLYRKANNKIFNAIGLYTQKRIPKKMVDRTGNATRELITALRQHESIFILNDQKMSTGAKIKFFGKEALTAKGAAILSLKYNVPIIPVYVKRYNKYYFEVVVEKEIDLSSNDVDKITKLINERFERWIVANPEMWFWIHNRWNIKKL